MTYNGRRTLLFCQDKKVIYGDLLSRVDKRHWVRSQISDTLELVIRSVTGILRGSHQMKIR